MVELMVRTHLSRSLRLSGESEAERSRFFAAFLPLSFSAAFGDTGGGDSTAFAALTAARCVASACRSFRSAASRSSRAVVAAASAAVSSLLHERSFAYRDTSRKYEIFTLPLLTLLYYLSIQDLLLPIGIIAICLLSYSNMITKRNLQLYCSCRTCSYHYQISNTGITTVMLLWL
jgi:hypothetical protein